jgi:methyl-accepting chemotaxis protein
MKRLLSFVLSMSLKKKLIMGYLFVSAMILGILGLISINFMKIKSNYDSIVSMSNDIQLITQLKSDINGIRASFLRMTLSNDPNIWAKQEDVIAMYSEKSDENLNKLKNGKYREKIREIEKTWLPFKETIYSELIPLIKSRKTNEAMNILGTVQAERSKEFMEIANEIIDSARSEFSTKMESINSDIKSTILSVSAIILILFSSAFVLSFLFINKYIINVLGEIRTSAEKVAKGDLTIKVEAKTSDEFGYLAQDVTNIIKTIRHVMRSIANKTVHILKDATSLTLYGKDVSQRVDKDLERTTTAATATEEMSATIGDIARNINFASQSAENAMKISLKGKEMINETVTSIESVNSQIEKASHKVKDLAEFSKKIDEIVVMIKDIADQTNLLALNAAIEAARAGEQGRGFAVVADEVRKLAQRTTNATTEINNILNSIHDGTISATDMMDVAVQKVKATSEIAKKLDESFIDIYNSFQKVADMVHQIVAATEEQSATVAEISTSLSHIAEDAKESSNIVKNMATSFNKFSIGAKEFLSILNDFHDPKMRVGIVKADYVLWLHRLMELMDERSTSLYVPEEFQPDKSRMGKWYYGEGKELFGEMDAYREIEMPHKKLHEVGLKAYEASKNGDNDAVKQLITEATKIVEDIIPRLSKFEQ